VRAWNSVQISSTALASGTLRVRQLLVANDQSWRYDVCEVKSRVSDREEAHCMSTPEARSAQIRTLVTIGLVILVVAVIAGLFFVAVVKVREAAARSQSTNNLKQMGMGIGGIISRTDGLLPPSVGIFPKDRGPNSTIFFHMQSDIEASPFYTTHKRNPDAITPEEGRRMKTFVAPLDPTNPGNDLLTSYASNAAVFGLTDGGTARYPKMFEKRGPSSHVCFMERFAVVGSEGTRHTWNGRGQLVCYLYPPKDEDDGPTPDETVVPQFDITAKDARNDAPHSFTGKTFQIGLADGSARTLTPNVMDTFHYADGRSATIWAWACSLDGPLAEAPTPKGW
jgi:hypothetical protein